MPWQWGPLALQRVSSQSEQGGASHGGDWREPSASVQDGSPLGLEGVAESNLVVARAGLAAAAQNISHAALLQRQGDYDGVAIAGPGPGGARHS